MSLRRITSVISRNIEWMSANYVTQNTTPIRRITSMVPSGGHENSSLSKYGGRHTVTLIPGDGIGPELAASVKEVFRCANVPVHFEEVVISGLIAQDKESIQDAVTSVKRNGVGLKGVLYTKTDDVQQQSLNKLLRIDLDLFANVVYCKNIPGLLTRHKDVDIIIIRENTEGEYSGLEHEGVHGIVESLKIITREKSFRIAKYAFDYALRHDRKKVTAIHKANIMKLSDGLFLRECEKVAKLYPTIKFNSMIIDNCCMQMVSNPTQFDVMVMPNLYGNIVSNIGAGLVGGAGVVPGKNVGIDYTIFEPGARHSAMELSSRNLANPTAMLLCSVAMLRHFGLQSYADAIEVAVYNTIGKTKALTRDIGGDNTTSSFVQAVVANLP